MTEERDFAGSRQRVNLAELLGVRINGLEPLEMFALLASSCEYLTISGIKHSSDEERQIFSPEQIFLSRDGHVEIHLLPVSRLQKRNIPPELQDTADSGQCGKAELQLVWCLGNSCRQAAQSGNSDVTLLSLLNLMTVTDVQSRPSINKVRQMIRNRLDLIDVNKVPDVISNLYGEVMGDLDELLADPFDDDIRFSSSRSSQLSIIPAIHDSNENNELLASDIADRLREDFSLTRNFSQSKTLEKHQNPELLETNINIDPFSWHIPDDIQTINLRKPLPSPRKNFSPLNFEKQKRDCSDDDELTPRGTTPIQPEEVLKIQPEEIPNIQGKFVDSSKIKEKEWKIDEAAKPLGVNDPTVRMDEETATMQIQPNKNIECVDVEIHPSMPINQMDNYSRIDGSQKPTRLYTKAAHTGKMPRTMAKKESEIEVISGGQELDPMRILGESDERECIDSLPPPVTGYSPGTKRKIQSVTKENKNQEQHEQEAQSSHFQRQNSLEPSRCSRREGSKRLKRNLGSKSGTFLPTVPEFLNNNTPPLIRLRAQSMKKNKLVTLHRSDPAIVYVRLLNGHSVEVNCRTDALVGSIFHTVAEHLNITEHLFFGLALKQQNEHVFLEEDQRLEKWAPHGWKGSGLRRSFGAGGNFSRQRDSTVGEQYTLYLRFRYYPKKREFVKTETTASQLYLQLRQDMLCGALRFSSKERAIEMAALALCVESTALPVADGKEYFKLENYMTTKFYGVEPSETLSVLRPIETLHKRLAASFGYWEAMEQFIARCQMEPLYGVHFYHVHKIKPKHGRSVHSRPFFADTRIIAIMPSGIGICREERDGNELICNSTHEWHMIRTLQFDRKRFLLGTIEDNIAVDHVFYTDHHSKASYLVRFSASQHRFMLKMRQWQGTLNRMHAVQRHKDVGVEQGGSDVDVVIESPLLAMGISAQQTYPRKTSQPQMGIGQRYGLVPSNGSHANESGTTTDDPSQLTFETEKEYIKYCYGSEAQRLVVVLQKDPDCGLGLTLVDGAVNGVKGVYVKSVGPEGDGKRKGLLIGDCILSINGTSLFNKSRHDAVGLVRDCRREVRLELLRFPSISDVLSQEHSLEVKSSNSTRNEPAVHSSALNLKKCENFIQNSIEEERIPAQQPIVKVHEEVELRKVSVATNESKASLGSGGTSLSASSTQRRQRAVSDFGAICLPTLRSDDLLTMSTTPTGKRDSDEQRYRRRMTSAGFPDSRNSDSDSDSDFSQNGVHTNKKKWENRRGEYKPQLPPVSAMYSFFNDEDDTEDADVSVRKDSMKTEKNSNQASPFILNGANKATASPAKSPFAHAVESFVRLDNADAISWNSAKRSAKSFGGERKLNNLDWANCLSDMDGGDSSSSQSPKASPTNHQRHRFNIRIPRINCGALPFEVQLIPGNGILISQIDAEKLPSSVNLLVGDRVVAVHGISVIGHSLRDVMEMMNDVNKAYIELIVDRDVETTPKVCDAAVNEEQDSLLITLDKTQNGAIGLSLAKRMGFDGVFVRNISPDSIAAKEGTLRVGDKVWSIQGEQLSPNESPANVVKRLKDLSGRFTIEVKRRRE